MELNELYNIYCMNIYNYLKDRLNAHIYVGIRNDKLGVHIEENDIGILFTMDDMLSKIVSGNYPTEKVANMLISNWRKALYSWYFKTNEKAV